MLRPFIVKVVYLLGYLSKIPERIISKYSSNRLNNIIFVIHLNLDTFHCIELKQHL